MWEVVAVCRETGVQRRIATTNWTRAKVLAMKALDKNWSARIKELYTDVLIADAATGDFLVHRRKLRPVEAAKYSVGWAKNDRRSGCLLWPHGWNFPEKWNVIEVEQGE